MRRSLFMLSLGLFACAAKPSAFGYTNGSRLHAAGYVHQGGAELWSIQDEKLGKCDFIKVGSRILCAPTAEAGIYFSDASCEVPIYTTPTCVQAPSHVSLRGVPRVDPCEDNLPRDDGLTIHAVEDTLSGPLYLLTAQGCTAKHVPLRGYTLSAPLDLTEAVTGTIESNAVDGFLVDHIAGSDGSKFLWQARDETLGVCELKEVDGAASCMPTNVAVFENYVESTMCEGPRLAYTERVCEPVAVLTNDGLFSLGESVPSSAVTRDSWSAFCGSAPRELKYYRAGPPVESLAFVERKSSAQRGLAVLQYRSASGALLAPAETFVDPNRGTCVAQPLSNGTIVCAPSADDCPREHVYEGEEDITSTLPVLQVL